MKPEYICPYCKQPVEEDEIIKTEEDRKRYNFMHPHCFDLYMGWMDEDDEDEQ